MKHYMKLQPEPFRKILSGKKTIELRLFDEKRRMLQPGDEIEFVRPDNKKGTLTVKITAVHRFDTFAGLYKTLPLEKCGYDENSLSEASPSDMEAYYPAGEQKKYGVVGIEFELCNRADAE